MNPRSLDASPRFSDGELDLWPFISRNLPNLNAIDTPSKKDCEYDRHELIDRLINRADERDVIFTVTHPDNVRSVGGRVFDIWLQSIQPDNTSIVTIPRYIFHERPEGWLRASHFRQIIPAFYILGSMAHELAHVDRSARNPDHYRALYEGFRDDNRDELDHARVADEEFATDLEAFSILQEAGIPMTPGDYAVTVPQSTGYHAELAERLARL